MKSFFCYGFLIAVLMVPAAAPADGADYDSWIPGDMVLYSRHGAGGGPAMEFPNYEKAIGQWLETLDDFLEWRVLRGEWEALLDEAGLENGFAPLAGDSRAVAVSGFGDTGRIPAVLYLSETNDPDLARETLRKTFEYLSRYDAFVQMDTDEYRGYLIESIYGPGMIPGLGLSYTLRDNMLILSTSKPFLIEVLERREFGEDTLAENELFKEAIATLPEPRSSTFFLNVTEINQSLENGLNMLRAFQAMSGDEEMAKGIEAAEAALGILRNVKAYASAKQNVTDEIQRTYGRLIADPAIAETPLGFLLKKEPAPLDFQGYLTRKTGSFQASNLLGLGDIWTGVRNLAEMIPDAQPLLGELEKLESEFGFLIENDLLSWMGDEWCLARPVMDLDAMVPVNRAALAVRVTDREKAKAGLDKLKTLITETLKAPVAPETEVYRSADLVTFRLPIPIIPIAPSWALDKDAFILSTHDSLIREMLDVKSGSSSGIERNSYFRAMEDYLPETANRLTFQDIEAEFYTYREGMKRVSSLSEMGEQFMPEDQQIPFMLLERGAYLLSCLQVMKASAKSMTVSPEGLETNGYLLMRDLRALPSAEYMSREKISLGAEKEIAGAAKFLMEAGDLERARRFYQTLLEFFPENTEYRLQLMQISTDMGDREGAAEIMSELMRSAGSNAFLISMEEVHPHDSLEGLLAWVNERAAENPAIEREKVLLGAALNKRAAGETALAKALFETLAEEGAAEPVGTIAKRELEVMESGGLAGSSPVPLITDFPTIDGIKDDGAWQGGGEGVTPFEPAHGAFKVYAARSGAQLYLLLEGPAPESRKENWMDRVSIYLCPSRDYQTAIVFEADVIFQDGELSIQREVRREPADPMELSLENDSGETIDSDWPIAHGSDGEHWYIECSLPIGLVEGYSEANHDTWLFNVCHRFEPESGPVEERWMHSAAAEGGVAASPLNYVNIRVED